MDLNELTAISPIDGRYRSKIRELDNYFSEFALFRYRLNVEIESFIDSLALTAFDSYMNAREKLFAVKKMINYDAFIVKIIF